MDVGSAINTAENALRDLITLLLRKKHGENWVQECGIPLTRIEQWVKRRDEEPNRRPGGMVEQRLIYYSDFYDLITIIGKNWDAGFKACFGDKKRFDVYASRLEAFRNPDAHARALLPFEQELALGITGEIRQAITMYLSAGAGDEEPEHFPRIEEVRDSFGLRVGGSASGEGAGQISPITLRPGDVVVFNGKAWDPQNGVIEWTFQRFPSQLRYTAMGPEIHWEWIVQEHDICWRTRVHFTINFEKKYHRYGRVDDSVTFTYKVLPPI